MQITLSIIALMVGLLSSPIGAQDVDSAETSDGDTAAQIQGHLERQARLGEMLDIMADEMAVIRQMTDGVKREEFMVIHRAHMREALKFMREMGGEYLQDVMEEHIGSGVETGMKFEQGQHTKNRTVSPAGRAEMSVPERLTDLEIRLDMVQVMLESMMLGDTTQ